MRVFGRLRVLTGMMLAGVAACGTSGGAGPAGTERAAPPAPAASTGGLTAAEIEAIYRERTESDRTRFTEADAQFMTGMIHHHAQAIEISRLAPSRTETSSIRTLAARIINAQQDEIALMQRWLEDRGQPVPEVHVTEAGVMVHGMEHGHGAAMPGMLTREQIRELEAARGAEFDRLFLENMIQHHEGAVTMVRALFSTDGAAQDEDAFRFASDVQVDQATEVARMKQMLETLRNP